MIGGGEGVVGNGKDAVVAADAADGLQIDDPQEGIGGSLDIHHPRFGAQTGADLGRRPGERHLDAEPGQLLHEEECPAIEVGLEQGMITRFEACKQQS